MKKRELISAIIAFFIGAGLMFLYTRNELQNIKSLRGFCIEALTVSQDLVKNCQEAYTQAGSCVANLYTCDGQATVKKLQELNTQKELLDTKMKDVLNRAQSGLK